ncbi:hypothetical protein CEUSTIGMA_g306.t1 [Chlamydomonas eustigma]|uniref:Uncharacterized protein n=1 Tax=Chlamydomonas eustigma TaxID=1157962 RepID=A0A250WPY0_9CHLO|nr:hypothetical protein CEUSTIGMA_g306.t1 [Chlamydomonas eustigma]|eukprot:GAX72851.1 hypothetical protein CEUSTIGMA_g306.t1 [Chlamydomonas eustigma]
MSDICQNYDAVLLDQFGVLHDGKKPYSVRTIEAVRMMWEAGIQIFIISNSSRRSAGTIEKLKGLGYDDKWFSGAVTSGDMTHQYLIQRPTEWWKSLGSCCVHLTWGSRGSISLEGLGLQVVRDISSAEFILVHGTQALGSPVGGQPKETSLDDIKLLLQDCSSLDLPMIVANPDLVTVDGDDLAIMPGTLAKWYENMGGSTYLMGKPSSIIYGEAIGQLGGVDRNRVLAIGDSMEHDIAGGSKAGLDTLFLAGGIHALELKAKLGKNCYDHERLRMLFADYGTVPTYTSAFLSWNS